MTREEAKSCIGTIEMLQRLAYNIHGVMDVIDADNCKKIIKALEQELCDCISREDAIRIASGYCHFSNIPEELKKLPSVNPQSKTGYISIDDVMSVFDDFMCGEVDEDGTETFLEMLKDKAESEDRDGK